MVSAQMNLRPLSGAIFSQTKPTTNIDNMGKIQFGSEVYTWFMQGTGKGYDNKLDHMIKSIWYVFITIKLM